MIPLFAQHAILAVIPVLLAALLARRITTIRVLLNGRQEGLEQRLEAIERQLDSEARDRPADG